MNVSGIPTLMMTRRLQDYVADTRVRLDTASAEAVTGFAADRAEKVGGDIGRVRKLEKLMADNERHLASIAQFKGDAATVQLTLSTTQEIASKLQFDLQSAVSLSNEEGIQATSATARAELEALFGRMNTSHGGRYLFSGAKTDTPPLKDVDTMLTEVAALLVGPTADTIESALDGYFNDPLSGFQANIYQGSTAALAPDREVDAGRRLGIELTANDDSVRETIRSLAVIALADQTMADDTLRDDLLEKNAKRIGDAGQALISEQTKLGTLEADAALLQGRHEASTLVLETQLRELLAVDQYEAASLMNMLETQLEAAYLTTSRIQQLSLVNYFR